MTTALIIQGFANGCEGLQFSSYWERIARAVPSVMDITETHCPANLDEEAAAVTQVIETHCGPAGHCAGSFPLAELTIIAALVTSSHCYATAEGSRCPSPNNDGWAYNSSLSGGAAHLWMEAGPNLTTLGLSAETT